MDAHKCKSRINGTYNKRFAGTRPEIAPVADVRQLDLTPRQFKTKFGGLLLFLPFVCEIGLDEVLDRAGFPGSKMVPAPLITS
ncbi:MAG: hypothetical protein ACLQVJ_21520 [Syntrophobacteraceae bacterium]